MFTNCRVQIVVSLLAALSLVKHGKISFYFEDLNKNELELSLKSVKCEPKWSRESAKREQESNLKSFKREHERD